jgi:hypothetical protein
VSPVAAAGSQHRLQRDARTRSTRARRSCTRRGSPPRARCASATHHPPRRAASRAPPRPPPRPHSARRIPEAAAEAAFRLAREAASGPPHSGGRRRGRIPPSHGGRIPPAADPPAAEAHPAPPRRPHPTGRRGRIRRAMTNDERAGGLGTDRRGQGRHSRRSAGPKPFHSDPWSRRAVPSPHGERTRDGHRCSASPPARARETSRCSAVLVRQALAQRPFLAVTLRSIGRCLAVASRRAPASAVRPSRWLSGPS